MAREMSFVEATEALFAGELRWPVPNCAQEVPCLAIEHNHALVEQDRLWLVQHMDTCRGCQEYLYAYCRS